MARKKYQHWIVCTSIIFCILILPLLMWAEAGKLSRHNNIFYEYHNINKEPEKTPLVICIPGFSQHNFSSEFLMLKNYFERKNYSYLVMNSPLHGEKTVSIFKKIFTMGNREIDDLKKLVDHLKISENHDEIHLLGFSMGARVVLGFNARYKKVLHVNSVISVAAPFSIGDIDGGGSGDIVHPFEGVYSTFQALDRSTVLKLLAIIIGGGISDPMSYGKSSPAGAISRVNAPTLLLHGSDDWLIKSYHALKLFDHVKKDHPAAVALLDTGTHAEDMLSRQTAGIRQAFFRILDKWFLYLKTEGGEKSKKTFNSKFEKELTSDCFINKHLYNTDRVTWMTMPTYNNLNTNIWASPANQNHSLFTINSAFLLDDDSFSRYFFTFGSTRSKGSIFDKIRLGLSFEKPVNSGVFSNFEFYTSFYNSIDPVPFLYLRRLTYIRGIGNTFNRRILSIDISLFKFDFRLNYGRFFPYREDCDKNVWQLEFHIPLISDAAGLYYLGLNYSRFLNPVPEPFFGKNVKAYLFIGPGIRIAGGSRIQGHIQVEQDGWHFKGARRKWSVGISINFAEK